MISLSSIMYSGNSPWWENQPKHHEVNGSITALTKLAESE